MDHAQRPAQNEQLCRACQALIAYDRTPIHRLDSRTRQNYEDQSHQHYEHHSSANRLRTSATRWSRPCPLCAMVWRTLSADEKAILCEPFDQETLRISDYIMPFYCISYYYEPSEFSTKGWTLSFSIPMPNREPHGSSGNASYSRPREFLTRHFDLLPFTGSVLSTSAQGCWLTAIETDCSSPSDLISDDIGDSTLSYGSVKLMIYWQNKCRREHDICGKHVPSHEEFIGFEGAKWTGASRLIEVGSHDEPVLRLRDASTLHAPGTPYPSYIALSHCWGTQKILRLESHTYEQFFDEIPYNELSFTFRHAIDFVRSLKNVKYLWIDSLCIIQDSEADMAAEFIKMHEIYTSALLTFAAAHASDGSEGCGVFRDKFAVTPPAITFKSRISALQVLRNLVSRPDPLPPPGCRFLCVDHQLWQREIDQSPLASRGWVAQERFLSSRILYFGRSQLFWQCAEMRACESFPQGCPPSVQTVEVFCQGHAVLKRSLQGMESLSRDDILCLWDHLVTNYSALNLTKQTDKLRAIAGMAQQFRLPLLNAPGEEFCDFSAGLWTGIAGAYTIRQLLWYTEEARPRSTPPRAPSWSWASVDSPVFDIFRPIEDEEVKIREVAGCVKGVDMTLVRYGMGAQYGDNRGGTILLSGMLIPSTVVLHDYGSRWGTDYVLKLRNSEGWLDAMTCKIDCSDVELSGQLFCVPLISHYDEDVAVRVEGLIVRRVMTTRGLYERIGLFWTSQDKEVVDDLMCRPCSQELAVDNDFYKELGTETPSRPFVFSVQ